MHGLINFSSHSTSPASPRTLKFGTKACLRRPLSNLFNPSCGIQSLNRLKTSMGTTALTWRSLRSSFMASCLVRKPSPVMMELTTLSPHLQTCTLPRTVLPMWGAQQGGGRQSKAAALVENSWEGRVKLGKGRQRSQMEECLSRSGQLQTGLAVLCG